MGAEHVTVVGMGVVGCDGVNELVVNQVHAIEDRYLDGYRVDFCLNRERSQCQESRQGTQCDELESMSPSWNSRSKPRRQRARVDTQHPHSRW